MMNEILRAEMETFGEPQQVLRVGTAAPVAPAPGELRVRMLAAPINPSDVNYVQGVYGVKPQLPCTAVGLEGCGVVEESAAEGFAPGDKVILLSGAGSWAGSMTAPAEQFLKVDAGLDMQQAAMLKINPLTAHLILTLFVDLKPGDWIIQNAANSGVGRCLIQLARARGLHTLNVVRGADARRDELMALGADIVTEDSADVPLPALPDGAAPRLASNCVGGESALRIMSKLGRGGTMVTFGAMSLKSLKVPNGWLIFKDISLRGLWCTRWLQESSPEQVAAVYQELASLVMEGKLTQPVEKVYPLSEVNTAVEHARREGRAGKIILDPSC